MVAVIFDTNILIDCLKGCGVAATCVRQQSDRVISVITQIELLSGAQPSTEQALRDFLAGFDVIHTDARVAEHASQIRRKTGLKLPDALILAAALCERRTLITRDQRILSADHGVACLCPYEL
jgi:predicted nucleic acid-binding protein